MMHGSINVKTLHVSGFVRVLSSGPNYIPTIVINFIEVGFCSVHPLFKEWRSVSFIFC